MKHIFIIALVASLFTATHAKKVEAAEFEISGAYINAFTGYDSLGLTKATDFSQIGTSNGIGSSSSSNSNSGFDVFQRVDVVLKFIASENLRAVLKLRAPNRSVWGNSTSNPGNHLGLGGSADNQIQIAESYLDWTIPNTEIDIRMGLQPIILPKMLGNVQPVNAILNDTVAGVKINSPITENIGIVLSWFRAFTGKESNTNTFTNSDGYADAFFLGFPMQFKSVGLDITPYGGYAIAGEKNQFAYDYQENGTTGLNNSKMTFGTTDLAKNTIWLALSGKYSPTQLSDLTLFADFIWGRGTGSKWDPTNKKYGLEFNSFIIDGSIEYATEFGSPRLFGWYATGDKKSDLMKGKSGLMPNFAGSWGYGKQGSSAIFAQHDIVVAPFSGGGVYTPAGTWALGLGLMGYQPMDKLTLNFNATYIRGTNEKSLFQKADGSPRNYYFDVNYMSESDSIVELSFLTGYDVYKELRIAFDVNYIISGVDDNLYKSNSVNGVRAVLAAKYSF